MQYAYVAMARNAPPILPARPASAGLSIRQPLTRVASAAKDITGVAVLPIFETVRYTAGNVVGANGENVSAILSCRLAFAYQAAELTEQVPTLLAP